MFDAILYKLFELDWPCCIVGLENSKVKRLHVSKQEKKKEWSFDFTLSIEFQISWTWPITIAEANCVGVSEK